MNITVTQTVTPKLIADLMTTFVESGFSNLWCDQVDFTKENSEQDWDFSKAESYNEDFLFVVHEITDYGDHPSVPHQVTPAIMLKGTQIMAEKYPRHFADIMNETGDANTADLWMQCILFGEETYA